MLIQLPVKRLGLAAHAAGTRCQESPALPALAALAASKFCSWILCGHKGTGDGQTKQSSLRFRSRCTSEPTATTTWSSVVLKATMEKTNEAEAQAGEALAAGTPRTDTGPAAATPQSSLFLGRLFTPGTWQHLTCSGRFYPVVKHGSSRT